MTGAGIPHLDATPVVEFVRRRGGPAGAGIKDPNLRRQFHRAQASGRVTWNTADRLAVRVMGRHPSTVFGREWWR